MGSGCRSFCSLRKALSDVWTPKSRYNFCIDCKASCLPNHLFFGLKLLFSQSNCNRTVDVQGHCHSNSYQLRILYLLLKLIDQLIMVRKLLTNILTICWGLWCIRIHLSFHIAWCNNFHLHYPPSECHVQESKSNLFLDYISLAE